MYSVVCFSHKHASRPIWRTLNYYNLVYLMVARQTTTSSPRTWYRAKHGSQPFGGELCRWDKLLAWCESLPVYLVYLCHPTKCGPVTFLASSSLKMGEVYLHMHFFLMSPTSSRMSGPIWVVWLRWHQRCHGYWTSITFETTVWGRERKLGWPRSLVPLSPFMPSASRRLSGFSFIIRTAVYKYIPRWGGPRGIKFERLVD